MFRCALSHRRALAVNRHTIAYAGNSILREIANPISKTDIADPATKRLIATMKNMLKEEGAMGLAAPQLSVSKRILVLQIPKSPLLPNVSRVPFIAMINPTIEPLGADTISMWESCLSFPGYWGKVTRHSTVRVNYLDAAGNAQALEAHGLVAGVVQHEADHLDGRLFVDRLDSASSLIHAEVFFQSSVSDTSSIVGGFKRL